MILGVLKVVCERPFDELFNVRHKMVERHLVFIILNHILLIERRRLIAWFSHSGCLIDTAVIFSLWPNIASCF